LDNRGHAARWSERRFPPPWSIEEQEACFVVTDRRRTKAVAAILPVPDRDFLSRFLDQVSPRAWLKCAKRIFKILLRTKSS
jgi:hypothetical protein